MLDSIIVQKILYKSEGFIRKNASTILTCIGAVGVVGTAVATAKGTTKADILLKKAKDEKGEDLSTMETVKTVFPAYIPAILFGTATITCIFGANIVNKRYQASLISAYTMLDRSYKEYKEKVGEIYGEEADSKIRNEIAKDKKPNNADPAYTDSLLFFDELSNRYFWSTIEKVRDAEYHFNRILSLRGYAELNELYDFLELEATPFGMSVGWSIEAGIEHYGYSWVDFYHELHESDDPDIPSYYTICMPFGPTADYMDF